MLTAILIIAAFFVLMLTLTFTTNCNNQIGEFFVLCMLLSFFTLLMCFVVATVVTHSNATTIYYRPISITKDSESLSTIVKLTRYDNPCKDMDFKNIKANDFDKRQIEFKIDNRQSIYLAPETNILARITVGRNLYGRNIVSGFHWDVYLRDVTISDL